MDIVTLSGIAVIAAALCIIVRQYRPEAALGISIACGIIITAAVLSLLRPSVETLSELAVRAGIDGSYTKVLFKALAVCYITQIASDGCRDAGESGIAARLELAGRAAVLVISLPVFTALAELVTQMLGGV
ncbi:MAG: stage III sporulation protein AD [Oscillospiraceae bacterium]|nr:stage III sporulation protein AD [Oscillospiraceae bacterium]